MFRYRTMSTLKMTCRFIRVKILFVHTVFNFALILLIVYFFICCIVCASPQAFGMETGDIPGSRITSSTINGDNKGTYGPSQGRVGNTYKPWIAHGTDHAPWIQVNIAHHLGLGVLRDFCLLNARNAQEIAMECAHLSPSIVFTRLNTSCLNHSPKKWIHTLISKITLHFERAVTESPFPLFYFHLTERPYFHSMMFMILSPKYLLVFPLKIW